MSLYILPCTCGPYTDANHLSIIVLRWFAFPNIGIIGEYGPENETTCTLKGSSGISTKKSLRGVYDGFFHRTESLCFVCTLCLAQTRDDDLQETCDLCHFQPRSHVLYRGEFVSRLSPSILKKEKNHTWFSECSYSHSVSHNWSLSMMNFTELASF